MGILICQLGSSSSSLFRLQSSLIVCSSEIRVPRRQALVQLDDAVVKGDERAALSIVRDLQQKPGALQFFGAARQELAVNKTNVGIHTTYIGSVGRAFVSITTEAKSEGVKESEVVQNLSTTQKVIRNGFFFVLDVKTTVGRAGEQRQNGTTSFDVAMLAPTREIEQTGDRLWANWGCPVAPSRTLISSQKLGKKLENSEDVVPTREIEQTGDRLRANWGGIEVPLKNPNFFPEIGEEVAGAMHRTRELKGLMAMSVARCTLRLPHGTWETVARGNPKSKAPFNAKIYSSLKLLIFLTETKESIVI